MPRFATPAGGRLREYNHCHTPAGSDSGGEFCSTTGGGPAATEPRIVPVSHGLYQVRDPLRPEPIGIKGPTGIRTLFSRKDAAFVLDKWVQAKARGQQAYKRGPQPGEFEDALSYAYGVVREFNACHVPSGPKGGQFCAGPGPGAITGEWTKSSRATNSRRATTGPMRPATAAERKRYKIPPSFVDAKATTDPRAEVRATAVSPTTGKTKAFYSKSYTDRQALAKWSRIAGVHRLLPKILKRVDKDSQTPASPDYQPAMALRLVLQTGMRNGAENENDTYGATSLQLRHAHVDGDNVGFVFAGKGKVQQAYRLTDPVLARYVTARKKAMGATDEWLEDLFSEDTAPLFDHTDGDTLAYLKKIGGKQYKVHDLRTWYATVYADQLTTKLLAEGHVPRTAKEKKGFQRQVATKVAERLGNTPAVTLKTYIHPYVWKEIE